jgi:hypothetical protein
MMPSDNNSDNNAAIAALKNQVYVLLVALIVVSGTLTVYLYRQVSVANKELAECQRVSALVVNNQNTIEALVGKLADYGTRHPDFQPVLKKYGITEAPHAAAPRAAAPRPAASPAAAPQAAPKK